jgi:hypothetical protein
VNVDKYQLLVDGKLEQELIGPRKELRFTVEVPAACREYTVAAVNAAGATASRVTICPEYGSGRPVVKEQPGGSAPLKVQ